MAREICGLEQTEHGLAVDQPLLMSTARETCKRCTALQYSTFIVRGVSVCSSRNVTDYTHTHTHTYTAFRRTPVRTQSRESTATDAGVRRPTQKHTETGPR